MPLSDVSFDSGLSKHKFGRTNIRYSPDGRLVTGEDHSLPRGRSYGAARDFDEYRAPPSNPFSDKRERARQAFYDYHGAYPSYETQSIQRQQPKETRSRSPEGYQGRGPSRSRSPYRENNARTERTAFNQSLDTSRDYESRGVSYPTSYPGSYTGYRIQPPKVPSIKDRLPASGLTRNDPYHPKPDWHSPVIGDYHYDKTGLIAVRNYNGEHGMIGKWHRRRADSPWSILFVSVGVFILLSGIVNVLFCLDYHYYCRFWTGFIVLEFGIFGLVHNGDWRTTWKTYCYVVLGILSVLAAFTSTFLLFETFIPQIILIYDLDNTTAYEVLQNARSDEPHIHVDSAEWVWVCFGFDIATFCLFGLSYMAGHASASCANRFYDVNWRSIRPCELYNKPRFFNPFGQINLGEVMALAGICVRYGCTYFSTDTEWYKYWSPVWAGALTCISGACAAGATKRSDNTSLILSAVFLELLSGASAVVAVVFCGIGMSDNINTINDSTITFTGNLKEHLTASAIVYAVATAVCIVQVAYAVGVLARLFSFLLSSRNNGYYGGPRNASMISFDSRSQATMTSQPHRDRYGRYIRGHNEFGRNMFRS